MEMLNYVEKQMDPNFTEKLYGMPNTSVTHFEITKNENESVNFKIILKADSSHLKD